MATLNKIRSKAGLLVVIIGVALLAFIVGDFLNSGHTFYAMNQSKVAVVNGTNIGVEEFQERVKVRTDELQQMYAQRGMSLPEGYVSRINQEVYDQMVNEILLNEELDELGIVVSKEELADLLTGDNISPMVRQYFTNPQTGVFDRQGLLNFMQVILDPEAHGYTTPEQLAQIEPQRQMWLRLEKQVKEDRAIQKFANLLNRAIMPNKLDLENSYAEGKTSANIAYALEPYTTIADSTIAISDSELKAEYNKVKELYKMPERRGIKYITVNIVPSQDDYAKAKEKVEMNKNVFATTNDVAAFVANNSDEAYDDCFVAVSSMPEKMKQFAQTAAVGESSPLEFENDTYTMYRLMDTKVAPDSIKVRLLSFQPRSTQIDSVLNVLNNGGSFAELSPKFNGNDEIWLTEEMAASVGRPFINKVFSEAGNGYFKAESLGGEHIVQILSRTAPVKKAKVAAYVLAVNPSTETHTALYNQLSSYSATNNTAEKFDAAAKEAGYTVNSYECSAEDYSLPGLNDARQAIRWAFNADKGAVSEIFTLDNAFVVAALDHVTKEGYAPLDQVKDMLSIQIRNDKKAEKMIADLKAKNITTLAGYAEAMKAQVDSAKFVSFSSPSIAGVGYEPVLSALAPTAENGKLVGPVKGVRGVYVFTVTDKTVSEQPFDAQNEARKLQQNYTYLINSRLMEVLRDKADIENTMIRFF